MIICPEKNAAKIWSPSWILFYILAPDKRFIVYGKDLSQRLRT